MMQKPKTLGSRLWGRVSTHYFFGKTNAYLFIQLNITETKSMRRWHRVYDFNYDNLGYYNTGYHNTACQANCC